MRHAEEMMQLALEQAVMDANEVPVGAVVVKDKEGKVFEIPADSVILSTGYKPQPLAEKAKNVHIVGDANKVGNLRTVIWGAWDVAMKL